VPHGIAITTLTATPLHYEGERAGLPPDQRASFQREYHLRLEKLDRRAAITREIRGNL
jgi:hypothetical protein